MPDEAPFRKWLLAAAAAAVVVVGVGGWALFGGSNDNSTTSTPSGSPPASSPAPAPPPSGSAAEGQLAENKAPGATAAAVAPPAAATAAGASASPPAPPAATTTTEPAPQAAQTSPPPAVKTAPQAGAAPPPPAEKPKPAPVMVQVTLEATFPFAVLDGGRQISAPATSHELSQPSGKSLTLAAPDFLLRQAVRIEGSASKPFDLTLPNPGTVDVRTAPEYATCDVVIEGRNLGQPPISKQAIASGPHRIDIVCGGQAVKSEFANIVPGQPYVARILR
jgi:hypothetical protein